MIFRVPPDMLSPSMWLEIKPLLESAMYGVPTHTIDDLKVIILENQAMLLIQAADHDACIEAAMLVDISTYPQGAWISVSMVGARPDSKLDVEAVLASLERLRIAEGCRGIQSLNARIGWLRKIPGVKREGYTMRLTME